MRSSLVTYLVIVVAALVPGKLSAQRLFVGGGGGLSRIDQESQLTKAATRPSAAIRAGFGAGRVKLVVDWQRHGLGDEQPLSTDYQGGITTRTPTVLRTDFLLVGAQVHLTRGLYVRPSVGVNRNAFPVYFVQNGIDAQTASISHEGGIAAALSIGYHLRVTGRFAFAIEASTLRSSGEDSSGDRAVVGLQVIPLLEF
jgi:hypothetical protein